MVHNWFLLLWLVLFYCCWYSFLLEPHWHSQWAPLTHERAHAHINYNRSLLLSSLQSTSIRRRHRRTIYNRKLQWNPKLEWINVKKMKTKTEHKTLYKACNFSMNTFGISYKSSDIYWRHIHTHSLTSDCIHADTIMSINSMLLEWIRGRSTDKKNDKFMNVDIMWHSYAHKSVNQPFHSKSISQYAGR